MKDEEKEQSVILVSNNSQLIQEDISSRHIALTVNNRINQQVWTTHATDSDIYHENRKNLESSSAAAGATAASCDDNNNNNNAAINCQQSDLSRSKTKLKPNVITKTNATRVLCCCGWIFCCPLWTLGVCLREHPESKEDLEQDICWPCFYRHTTDVH